MRAFQMPRVLVVEDEAIIAVDTADVLENKGFTVDVTLSAEDALQRLRNGPAPDILFTDMNLAGAMDGAALAQIARKLLPDLIVVYTSGTVTQVAQPVAGSTFVPKPYHPENVCALLTRMAARRRTDDHSAMRPLARNSSSQWM